jgi:hypothetical protein
MVTRVNPWIRLAAIILAGLVAAGCGHVEIQTHTPQNIDRYQYRVDKDGFRIVVDPFKEDTRLVTYFGCDLLSMGIYPLFVMMENHNAEDGFVLINDKVSLVKNSADAATKTTPESTDGIALHDNAIRNQAAAANVLTTVSPLFLPVLPVAVIFASASSSRLRDDAIIRRNLEDRQMPTKTLYPGGSVNGFLYFKIDKKDDVDGVQGVTLVIKNLRTNELKPFLVHFN